MKHSSFKKIVFTLALSLGIIAIGFSADEGEGPEFLHDFDKAVEAAGESSKPVVVVFSASWCPPCQQMKKAVYPSEAVQPFHDKFVWAYLDTDESKNSSVASEFGVSGIPHIVFLKPDAEPIGYFSGAIPPEEFVKVLEKALKSAAEGEPEDASEVSAVSE